MLVFKLNHYSTSRPCSLVPRGFDASTVATDMKQALELKAEFPQQVMGYDLVGQEDPGHTLHYFLDDLLAMNKNVPENLTLPFIFHAGETSEYRTE